MRERILNRVVQFVPCFGSRRTLERLWHKFVPTRHRCAAFVTDTARQHIEEEQATRYLPSAEIADAGTAPNMSCEFAFAVGNQSRRFLNALDRHFRFFCGAFKGVFGIEVFEQTVEQVEC